MDADNLHRRLKKIIGQLGAIDKMVDQDVPCEDMLMQINAAKSALHKVGQVVLEGHLNHCVPGRHRARGRGPDHCGIRQSHRALLTYELTLMRPVWAAFFLTDNTRGGINIPIGGMGI